MSRFASMICFSFSLAVAAFLEPVGTLADDVPEGGLHLPDLSGEEIRSLPRRQRTEYMRIKALEEVMREEGPEFSQEKFDVYNLRFGLGLGSTALGGGAILAGGLLVVLSYGVLFGCSEWDYEDGYCDTEEREREEERVHNFRIAGISSMIGGAMLVGVGVPFLISGKKGRNRQRQLMKKEEIMRPLKDESWKLSVLHSQAGIPAGLNVSVVF